jgi:two-component system CitB family sensor kinase
VLTGRTDGLDEVILVNDHVLLVNRMPVELRGRSIGAVVTLRDRTELETLVRERDDLRSLADALRAQEHEFANRLHVLGGLMELKRYDDAVNFINLNSQLHQELAAALVERVRDPLISALLLGKASVASERGINLRISAALEAGTVDDPQGLVTVIGNLIDNAMESAGHGGRVDVSIDASGDNVEITVHDSGPGIDESVLSEVFRDGYTTKIAHDGPRRRGLGLALVSQEVRRRRGEIQVENVDGARFTVAVPRRIPARMSAGEPA